MADAQADPSVGTTMSNPNRLNLHQITRYSNGNVVDPLTYSAVRKSAYNIARSILWPLNSKVQPELAHKTGKNGPGTKSFYRSYFWDKWMEAITRLEEMQPLLALCEGHYKADAFLQSVLDGLRLQTKNDSHNIDDGIADDMDDDNETSQVQQGKRPGSPSVSRSPKRNRVSSTPAAVDLSFSRMY